MVDVGIIGLGPWGLCALERIVNAARQAPAIDVTVHVVDPERPGGGLYSRTNPDYIILNTPCGQHCMTPYPDDPGAGRLATSFYEWATEKGYRWRGLDCRISTSGEPISPHDFLPRRLMGEYLEWAYETLLADAPINVTIRHHATAAVDIEPTEDGRELLHLERGPSLLVDQVVLTTGHSTQRRAGDPLGRLVTPAYPVRHYVNSVSPGEELAIEGMGLVALDIITALTIGLGGHYTDEGGGRLRYHPSGREPVLYLFSRSGFPYCAKSIGTADPMGDYEPAICTTEAVAAMQHPDGGHRRQIDARKDLLPLVFAEMDLVYYTRSALAGGGPSAAEEVRRGLVGAWEAGTFAAACAAYGRQYGSFSAAERFFVGEHSTFLDAKDYETEIYSAVEADVSEAMVSGGASPVKAAFETLRALRDTLRSAIEFKGLTVSSYLDFQSHLHSRFARLVAGPPVVRSQEMLALLDAGLLRLPFGPSPEVERVRDGVVVRSTRLERPVELGFERLVRGHLDTASVTSSMSPLLTSLANRGRARPLTYGSTPVGSIDLTEDFHPVNVRNAVEPRLWVFGALSEGVRYFTGYIPSPKSRVRAFQDAELCANEIIGSAMP